MWIVRNEIICTDLLVCEVAAAATGHENFLADLVRAFKNDHASSALACRNSAHQPGGTAANNYDIVVVHGGNIARIPGGETYGAAVVPWPAGVRSLSVAVTP